MDDDDDDDDNAPSGTWHMAVGPQALGELKSALPSNDLAARRRRVGGASQAGG